MSRKYAVSGKPDFHNLSDEQVKSFLELSQQMVFAYKYFDPEKAKVLEDIWKDLNSEDCDRLVKDVDAVFEEQKRLEKSAGVSIKVPKFRKSLAKRKS